MLSILYQKLKNCKGEKTMFEIFILFLLAIACIFMFGFLIFLLGELYFKHYDKKNIDINEKYFFEKENIKEHQKIVRDLEKDYHQKITILKDFCPKEDEFLKTYARFKIVDIAETLVQENDNLNDEVEIFKNKMTDREYQAISSYYTRYQRIDLKDKDYENIILRYKFLKNSID